MIDVDEYCWTAAMFGVDWTEYLRQQRQQQQEKQKKAMDDAKPDPTPEPKTHRKPTMEDYEFIARRMKELLKEYSNG
jgi:hypothetical protein